MIRLVILISVALVCTADDPDVITVPRDVLKFIIGCNQGDPFSAYSVPVHKTEISDIDGTTSQHVSLLSLEELRDSLKLSVHNEDVLGHIIQQIEDAAKSDKISTGRSDCAVENHISIAIPPQEMDEFNDRIQQLMQMNSRLLLEQVNNVLTYKLVRQKTDAERLLKRKTNQILHKLDKIMTHLGIPNEDESNGNDEDDQDEMELVTTLEPFIDYFPTSYPQEINEPQGEPEPVSEPEPEPEPQTTFRPPSASTPAAANEGVTEMVQPVPVTELLQPATTVSGTSSEEDTDDDDHDRRRVGSPSNIGAPTESDFIRTPQQPPIVFNNGIGLIPSITRQRQRIRQKTRVPPGTRFSPVLVN